MKQISVIIKSRIKQYKIYLKNNLNDYVFSKLYEHLKNQQVILLTDKNVYLLYAKSFINKLINDGYLVLPIIVNPGERSKSYSVKEYVESEIAKEKFNKYATLIVLGGGVVGDLGGFVAATYMRGISYINFPTTFLSMVDSSIGGKNSINTKYGKNLIGTYYLPECIFINQEFLQTLPNDEYIYGLVESIKLFIINDKISFQFFYNNINKILLKNKKIMSKLIYESIKNKNEVIKLDYKDNNIRMILNFGHTIGHSLEKISKYKLPHGYAVGLGIILEIKISLDLGILNLDEYKIIINLLSMLGINKKKLKNYSIDNIIDSSILDKKNSSNDISIILLKSIGEVYTDNKKVVTMVKVDQVKKSYFSLIS